LLEGIFELPLNFKASMPGAVICHPHPLFGGNMHNNVVRALRNGFLEKGIATLRFNFRGTGRSDGTHGNGIDEMEDVRAAIDYLASAPEVDPDKLMMAGYSFGCWVGLRTAHRDQRPKRLIGISPPLDSYDFSFLKSELRPTLLIVGDGDFVCSLEAFERFSQELPMPKMTSILSGVDHFHFGTEQDLVSLLYSFMDLYPLEPLS
jgi:hypothetical protein